eukprot:gene4163-8279_t
MEDNSGMIKTVSGDMAELIDKIIEFEKENMILRYNVREIDVEWLEQRLRVINVDNYNLKRKVSNLPESPEKSNRDSDTFCHEAIQNMLLQETNAVDNNQSFRISSNSTRSNSTRSVKSGNDTRQVSVRFKRTGTGLRKSFSPEEFQQMSLESSDDDKKKDEVLPIVRMLSHTLSNTRISFSSSQLERQASVRKNISIKRALHSFRVPTTQKRSLRQLSSPGITKSFLQFYTIGIHTDYLCGRKKFSTNSTIKKPPEVIEIYPTNEAKVIDSIADFCFPDGVYLDVMQEGAANYITGNKCDITHIAQFTDLFGTPTYGCFITVTEKKNHNIRRNTSKSIHTEKSHDSSSNHHNEHDSKGSKTLTKLRKSLINTIKSQIGKISSTSTSNTKGTVKSVSAEKSVEKASKPTLKKRFSDSFMMTSTSATGVLTTTQMTSLFSNDPEDDSSTSVPTPGRPVLSFPSASSTIDDERLMSDSGKFPSNTTNASNQSRSTVTVITATGGGGGGDGERQQGVDENGDEDNNGGSSSGGNGISSNGGSSRLFAMSRRSTDDDIPSRSFSRQPSYRSSAGDDLTLLDSPFKREKSRLGLRVYDMKQQLQRERLKIIAHRKLSSFGEHMSEIKPGDVLVTQRAFCLISSNPCHTFLFEVLQAIVEEERSSIFTASSCNTPTANTNTNQDKTSFARSDLEDNVTSEKLTARNEYLYSVQVSPVLNSISPSSFVHSVSSSYVYKRPSTQPFVMKYTLEDWTSTTVFALLPVSLIAQIMYGLLSETSLVVYGTDIGLVTTIATGVKALLTPFTWEGVFVPILPRVSMEMLEAPVPYIIGTTTEPVHPDVLAHAAVLFIRTNNTVTLQQQQPAVRTVYNSTTTTTDTPNPSSSTATTTSGVSKARISFELRTPVSFKDSWQVMPEYKSFCHKLRELNLSVLKSSVTTGDGNLIRLPTILNNISENVLKKMKKINKIIYNHNMKLCGDISDGDGWTKYGILSATSGLYDFYPDSFMQPRFASARYQDLVVRTQLFFSYVEKNRIEYLKNKGSREFIAWWIYFRRHMAKKKKNKEKMSM